MGSKQKVGIPTLKPKKLQQFKKLIVDRIDEVFSFVLMLSVVRHVHSNQAAA